jgi:hypothetical protein
LHHADEGAVGADLAVERDQAGRVRAEHAAGGADGEVGEACQPDLSVGIQIGLRDRREDGE